MNVSSDELMIIADDGRGLSQDDRECIREAAASMEAMSSSYFKLRGEICELERKLQAREERIKELTRKPADADYGVSRVSMGFYLLPSWARFKNV